MIRLFVGLKLPPDAGRALADLRRGVDGAAWHSAEKFHLTLRFIGEVDDAQTQNLEAELALVQSSPFDLRLAGAGAFDREGVLDSLWIGAENRPQLRRLRVACEQAARRIGLPTGRSNWRPHVTLAYLMAADRGQVAAWIDAHRQFRLPPIPVQEFCLYSSAAGPEGRVYRLERTYPLQLDA